MAYFLCIDVGNTLQKLAVFKQDRLVYHRSSSEITIADLKSVFNRFEIYASILAEVKSIKVSIKNYLRKHSVFIEMGPDLRLPVRNKYKTPLTLGKDRLAAVAGAVRLYPGSPLLIIGIGTCITYDYVSARNEYLGGLISPGLDMRLKAMHRFTARLPSVEVNLKAGWIGNSTDSAMQGGGLWGMIMELEGIIARNKKEIKGLKVVLSGGGADFYKNRLKKPIFAHPNLVLLGLKEMVLLNVSNS